MICKVGWLLPCEIFIPLLSSFKVSICNENFGNWLAVQPVGNLRAYLYNATEKVSFSEPGPYLTWSVLTMLHTWLQFYFLCFLLFTHLFICWFIYVFIYLFVGLFSHLLIHLFFYSPANLFIYLFIYLLLLDYRTLGKKAR